jgi:hypothetical protein
MQNDIQYPTLTYKWHIQNFIYINEKLSKQYWGALYASLSLPNSQVTNLQVCAASNKLLETYGLSFLHDERTSNLI